MGLVEFVTAATVDAMNVRGGMYVYVSQLDHVLTLACALIWVNVKNGLYIFPPLPQRLPIGDLFHALEGEDHIH
ncbi:MAG: hypothetical protein PHQ60_12910 [Sideroxydans sp.]|nr:hypothetical protein [Sideroxydans sp.]